MKDRTIQDHDDFVEIVAMVDRSQLALRNNLKDIVIVFQYTKIVKQVGLLLHGNHLADMESSL